MKITLTEPVKYGDETITELVLRKPRGRDFRELKNMDSPFGAMLDMAAGLADVSPKVMDDLCAEDTLAVVEVVSGFFPTSLQTGKK